MKSSTWTKSPSIVVTEDKIGMWFIRKHLPISYCNLSPNKSIEYVGECESGNETNLSFWFLERNLIHWNENWRIIWCVLKTHTITLNSQFVIHHCSNHPFEKKKWITISTKLYISHFILLIMWNWSTV